LQSPWIRLIDLDDEAWVSSLWLWAQKRGYHTKIPATSPHEDKGERILESYIRYELSSMSEGQSEDWKNLASNIEYDYTTPRSLRGLKERVNTVAKMLRSNEMCYVRDLGDKEGTNKRTCARGMTSIKRKYNYLSNQKDTGKCSSRWVELLCKAGIVKRWGRSEKHLTHHSSRTSATAANNKDMEITERRNRGQWAGRPAVCRHGHDR